VTSKTIGRLKGASSRASNGIEPPLSESTVDLANRMLSAGDRLGPYLIVAPLGAGGMGEVYRAEDTRLGRTVAVKVLSSTIYQREDIRQRFEREARAVSKLNHPHICTLYDIGRQDGIDYLVMECLEGETVQTRLKKAPLPLSDLLKYGIQIANALDRAHRSGIVHRDLKPANIMLTKDGAKLLDFGLAKRQSTPAALDDQTLTNVLTSEGTLLGTLPYMAPEQLEGKQADARTDIFAFGDVLFEMLTCRKAFIGDTQANLIAAIMNANPPLFEDIDFVIPPTLERIVRTCLEKNPEDRWQSARDIALALKFVAELPDQPLQDTRQWTTTVWPWLAGVFLIGMLAMTAWSLYHRERNAPLLQLEIAAPDKSEFSGFGSAISPDGRFVAFVATTEGKERLWLRPLDARNARMLEDTDEAQFPFWSPDSSSIGFFAGNKLKRFDLNGVGSRSIANAPNGRGGTWSRYGVIVYSPNLSSRLWKVASTGGEPAPATILDSRRGDARHNFPQFLPDGRHFLFFVHGADPQKSGPYIGSLDDPNKIEAIPQLKGNAFQAIYAPSGNASQGNLIYVRDRSLVAQSFNTGTLRLEGEPQIIVSRDYFSVASSPGFLNLTDSATGTLLDGGAQRARNELVWRKRDGTLIEVAGEESDYITPRISPDGSRIAVTRSDPVSGDYDIWINDWKRNLFSRFTFQRGLDFYPLWTPDGKSIIYTSDAAGRPTLFRKPIAGSGEPQQLLKDMGANQYGYDVSSDGKFLLFVSIHETERGDIWILPLDNSAAPFPYLKTPAGELHPQFSPGPQGGKWIVYTSDESGTEQIYVRRFTGGPAADAKWQISSSGGKYPYWRGDGNDIVYLAPDGKLTSVAIRFTSDSLEVGASRALFNAALPSSPFSRYPYDISSDGKRFLVLNAARGHAPGTLTLLLNWTGLLKR
jgi:eukaryotic-like serine/threonine-protein kinase